MRVGKRLLKPETVTWLREVLQEGELTRSAIARELCERDGWKNRQGVPCAASARTALPRLAEALALPLPAPLPQPDNRAGADPGSVHAKPFAGRLEQLGAVRLRLVEERAERGLWRSMLLACHPLGEARAPGKRLTYLLESAHEGVLGGLSFVAAPMRLGPRDKLLGWSPRAREAHLEEVLSNDRFLILDWIKVPHLASHALGIAARQVPADWQRRHGVLPLLLETCVGPDQTGTSYQAAGWDGVGETGGKVPGTEIVLAPKQVWLRALDASWKERLRAEPERQLGVFPSLELDEDAGWGEREFGRSDLSDGRLRERMVAMGTAWERVPGALLPAVFAHKAAQVGAYRFLHNDQVSATDVLQPHREALVERCRQQASVLLVQDTTTLNYSGLAGVADGLGPLGDKSKASAGLYVHAAVAFTEGGRPLGVSGLEVWARAKQGEEKPAEKESGRWLAGFEQGVQLAAACPGTRVTVVGDRESDIYTLFERQAQCSEQVGLVVRVSAGRQRRVSAEEWIDGVRTEWLRPLQAHMDCLRPVARNRKVVIDSRGGKSPRKRRVARTELRIAWVELQPPKTRPGAAALGMLAVQVREMEETAGEEPLEWLLLASDGEKANKAQALRIVRQYEGRWPIEEYFRVLKSGTRVEDRRLRDAAALGKCLAFDAVAAWRVFDLGRAARDCPQAPARRFLSRAERDCILAVVRRERLLPPGERGRPPPEGIRWWVLRMASMVGFHPSKRRPAPGNEKMWQAYRLMRAMVRGIEAHVAAVDRD